MKKICFIMGLIPTIAYAAPDCATMQAIPDTEQTLTDIIHIGLCRNPQTSAAFQSLRAAKYNKNAGYANYLPSVSIGASAGKNYQNESWDDWSYGASISASYLIFDFGKRLSDMNQMIDTYRAAGFEFNETVQNFVYGLVGAYYELLNADADVKSAELALSVAKTAYDTANKKFKAGSVARADVLKAETTLAGSELSLERAKNNREIAQGTLLTKLSFPADQEIKIADMSSTFGTDAENEHIDELIEIARKKRPDLLRATAQKDAAWHKRNSAFLKNLPSISASGSVSWNENSLSGLTDVSGEKINGSIGIRISMPLFAGFANMYGARSAVADYERAKYNEQATIDNAMLDIFTAYQNYKTAQTVLKQTETLLKSAEESERVTSGMYKVGRSTMLDWQTAQSELVDAQKQHNSAKYDLFIKRAAVALAIGDIKSELEGEKYEEQTDQE